MLQNMGLYGYVNNGWNTLSADGGYGLNFLFNNSQYSNYQFGGGGFESGGVGDFYAETSANVPYLNITYTAQQYAITGMYPAAGAVVPRTLASRFGWTLSPTTMVGTQYGDVTQVSGTFQWRVTGSSTINSRTLGASGTSGYVDIPANTFTATNIKWRVVINSNMGLQVTSNWIDITTDDLLSSAEVIAPTGVVVEDVEGVTFSWRHVSPTGTANKGFLIQTSVDQGTTWSTLVNSDMAATTYTAAHNAVPTGSILWRVATKNSTSNLGSYSAPAGVVVRAAPDAPAITYVDTKPRITVRWQSTNQQAYRVVIGSADATVFDTGLVFGSVKEFRINEYLPDGDYSVQVQIQNDSGLISAFATVNTTVSNVSKEAYALRSTSNHAYILLSWEMVEGTVRYYVMRDSQPIAVIEAADIDLTEGAKYHDYFCCGMHQYQIMAVDADDYYTLSNTLMEKSLPAYGLLVPVGDPSSAVLLKYRQGSAPSIGRTGSKSKELVSYAGREKPVAYVGINRTVSNAFQYTFKNRNDRARVEVLDGAEVLFKNHRGERIFGTLDSVGTDNGRFIDISFQIIETDYSEVVAYL